MVDRPTRRCFKAANYILGSFRERHPQLLCRINNSSRTDCLNKLYMVISNPLRYGICFPLPAFRISLRQFDTGTTTTARLASSSSSSESVLKRSDRSFLPRFRPPVPLSLSFDMLLPKREGGQNKVARRDAQKSRTRTGMSVAPTRTGLTSKQYAGQGSVISSSRETNS